MKTILPVGTKIKSYDFYKMNDSYMFGEIVALEGDIYQVTLERRVIEKAVKKIESEFFYTPVQGAMIMDDLWDRIVVVI